MNQASRTEEDLLSIGGLSRETGLSVETLRTWERRYGYPSPIRRPSGHRRYPYEVARRLRLVRRALSLGLRPGRVVPMPEEELRPLLEKLLGEQAPDRDPDSPSPGRRDAEPLPAPIRPWLARLEELDAPGLDRDLRVALARWGRRVFLEERLIPFLRVVGERWAAGELGILHEHLASERVEAFLSGQWLPLADAARGPRVVIAGLPGEAHVLALHMAAWILAGEDHRVLYLGSDTPPEEIATATRTTTPRAVVTGVSAAASPATTRRHLVHLGALLPEGTELLVGGTRIPDLPRVQWLPDLTSLEDWARRAGPRPANP